MLKRLWCTNHKKAVLLHRGMKLSIVIPAYNEEARVTSTLTSILRYFQQRRFAFEIIVVDDGSTDATVSVVENLADKRIRVLRLGRNQGKGKAVHQGITHARYDYVLFTDADLSTPIQDFELLEPHIEHYDIVIGSRNLPESLITRPQPWLRSTLGKTFPLLVRAFVVPDIKDTQCGFKLFSQKAIKTIAPYQTIFDFGFDVELLFLARKARLAVKEIGVHWGNADGSTVNPVRDSGRMFMDLWKIRWNDLCGRYTLDTGPRRGSRK